MIRSAVGISSQLEAVTAERDFFRERYAAQIDELEGLKTQLKESQRTIDKLRNQILDLEVERSRLVEQVSSNIAKSPKRVGSSSSNTSVTSATCDEDSTKSFPSGHNSEINLLDANISAGDDVVESLDGDEPDSSKSNRCEGEVSLPNVVLPEAKDVIELNSGSDVVDDEKSAGNESDGDDKDAESTGDEANQIRANAERMLIWANYQTARRTTPVKESANVQDEDDVEHTPTRSISNTSCGSEHIIQSIPASLHKARNVSDDTSSLGSNSRNNQESSVGSWRSGGNARTPSGKIGSFLNNLRDIIHPAEESHSDDESDVDSESDSD